MRTDSLFAGEAFEARGYPERSDGDQKAGEGPPSGFDRYICRGSNPEAVDRVYAVDRTPKRRATAHLCPAGTVWNIRRARQRMQRLHWEATGSDFVLSKQRGFENV